ncbi:hypothetical protein NKJ26_27380 [Mesorhizobium sp. M0152]|uniref:hypothetical protein n=1 Tax=Mesorhizobium sp. M0152 TaxID=2956898 RepID=UPI00333890C9
MILFILILLIVLLFTGMPIFAALGLASLIVMGIFEGNISSMADTVFSALNLSSARDTSYVRLYGARDDQGESRRRAFNNADDQCLACCRSLRPTSCCDASE